MAEIESKTKSFVILYRSEKVHKWKNKKINIKVPDRVLITCSSRAWHSSFFSAQ